jgi:NAD(P)-dependent dehydrogenase (short-subunit alcohol dehydrogenase family)
MKLHGKIVAITGAGSGIGRALAIRFAEEGAQVALSDVNQAGLEETRVLAAANGARVSTQMLDVADREAMHAWAEFVVREHGAVHIIVNNAGVGLGATVEGMTYGDFEWLMAINFWGVVHGTKAFLPHIKQAGEGAVVNVSSVFGFIGIPTQSAYNAAKFAVRGFTESLQMELNIEGGKVRAFCVHPGGIKTNIARNSRMGELASFSRSQASVGDEFEKIARTTPKIAAEVIVAGLQSNRSRILIGADAHLIDWVQRIFPSFYKRIVANLARRAQHQSGDRRKPQEKIPL